MWTDLIEAGIDVAVEFLYLCVDPGFDPRAPEGWITFVFQEYLEVRPVTLSKGSGIGLRVFANLEREVNLFVIRKVETIINTPVLDEVSQGRG